MRVVVDAEFDSLTPTRLWCIVCKEVETGEVHVFRYDQDKDWKDFQRFALSVTTWIGHNFLCFDTPAIHRLIGPVHSMVAKYPTVIDTLICSRLIWYKRPGGHSMENIGKGQGQVKKEIIEYDRPELIDEYVERCISDVEINYKFYKDFLKQYIDQEEWQDSIKLEHELALICQEISENGFAFNIEAARTLLADISSRLEALTKEIRKSVGTITEVDKVVTLRRKKNGEPDSRTGVLISCYRDIPSNFSHGDDHTIFKTREFNPGSPKDRISLLNRSGWSPTIKTKTHEKAEREYRRKGRKNLTDAERERWGRLAESGWQVCEENLKTLPKDAPTGAKKLAEWLTLEGRRADLEEWIGQYNERTGRIHSNILHIGSWTHRCAHNNPNCANIFSQFHGEVSGPVDHIKYKYDGLLRSLWEAGPSSYLVGSDAEGIQLRILAELMGDEDYINAVAHGNKDDKTDVHNVNLRALGLPGLVRDDAKTFIYAWLLGAGTGRISSILRCSARDAKRATNSFMENLPSLNILKRERIPSEAKRGYFEAFDGRKVICDSEHFMLAGHLQANEKIIMARANLIWRERLQELGIDFRQVNFVHDEWQTEVFSMEEAEIVGKVQCEAITQAGVDLGMKCPLAGTADIGLNWLETH